MVIDDKIKYFENVLQSYQVRYFTSPRYYD
jgi:hypothetical protein